MSQWDEFDNLNSENGKTDTNSDAYTTENSADIYNTPDVSDGMSEEMPAAEVVVESVPVEEAPVVPYNNNPYNNSQYGNNPYIPYGGQMPPNGNQGNPYNNNPYNNNPYNNNPYGGQYSNNPYSNNPYNNNSYGGQYNDSPHNNNLNNNNPYGNQYNNNPNNDQYNNNPYNNAQYGNNSYNPYGGQIPPNGGQNGPYSPYAAPPKKNKNGLIIGIVIGIIVLFLIAVFALAYKAVTLFSQNNNRRSLRDEYEFDYDKDDWGSNRNQRDRDRNNDYDDYDDDDWYDDYDYDDWYDDWYDDYYYDDDSPYYELHDDIRSDLSYSVDMEYYEYDTDNEYVDIWATYPVIEGRNVPNLNMLNNVIQDEVDFFVSLFDEDYEDYFSEDYDYYEAYIMAYVTYMDEEKMSIVFDERIYSSYYNDVYLYSINIDMENGVVMDNENIIRVDDDFSVDFRERSDIQNGEISYLTIMSDQEITDHFNSTDIIVFYTPMGMEIGFNYDEGWVTVTYDDYEQYLKVF